VTIPLLNTAVPDCHDKNVQLCLDLAEGATGSVDAQVDALIAPETFQPACALTFTPVVKGGEDTLAFGWYNVKADPANPSQTLRPANTELYAMMVLPHGFQSNAQLAAVTPPVTLDLVAEAAAGRYLGGEVAFWLGNSEGGPLQIHPETRLLLQTPIHLYYTEHAFNPGSAASQTFYQVLTWQSAALENAFYFGWEDRPASAGDNDFDDVLIQVSGIQCSGGGGACDTGLEGVCAEGTMLCQRGALTCLPNVPASDETCNALDDNCDGSVDEGDDLCEVDYVCDRGRCVPRCGTGEFRCLDSQTCTEAGLCVETACVDVQCPAGQVCHGGECSEACVGVTCPYGRICRNDACVDPCANIECDAGSSCVMGICQSCECSTCEGDLVCQNNACVDPACMVVSCDAGTHCEGGSCVDNCLNAACPSGSTCSAGECVLDGTGTGGGGSIIGIDGGIVVGSGTTSSMDPVTDSDVGRRQVGSNDGCACELMRRPSSSLFGPLLGALALVMLERRRRRVKKT
jgi:hypothetical protein